VFFDPSLDPKGAGWQIDQSMIALGSGGIHGKGWRQGTETVLGYLPKNTSYNDLISPWSGKISGFSAQPRSSLAKGPFCCGVCGWRRVRETNWALVAVG